MRETWQKGKQLKFAREYRGLTQTELSEKSKITQNRISRFEKGFGGLSDNNLTMLMNVLNFPIAFLDRRIYNVEILGKL